MHIIHRLLLLALLASPATGFSEVPAPAPAAVPSSQLRKAKEMLRLAEETRARIRRDAEAAQGANPPDPVLVAGYATYLDRVERMVAAYARMVQQMESMSGPSPFPADPGADPGAGLDPDQGPAVSLPDSDVLDPVLALDRELNAALAEFDKILLKEQAEIGAKMEEVAQSNQEKLQELAQQAAEAAAKIKERREGASGAGEGAAEGAEGAEPGAGAAEGAEAVAKGGAPGAEAAKPGAPAGTPGTTPGAPGEASGGENPGGAEATGGMPDGGLPGSGQAGASTAPGKPGESNGKGGRKIVRPGAEDDDIVARQLREAAEAETDPVLKEKLWKEYEDYKKSSRR